MKPNKEGDKCSWCLNDKGDISIFDDNNSYWICGKCDNKMGWKNEKNR